MRPLAVLDLELGEIEPLALGGVVADRGRGGVHALGRRGDEEHAVGAGVFHRVAHERDAERGSREGQNDIVSAHGEPPCSGPETAAHLRAAYRSGRTHATKGSRAVRNLIYDYSTPRRKDAERAKKTNGQDLQD